MTFIELTDKRFGKTLINVDHIEQIRMIDGKVNITMQSTDIVFVNETIEQITEIIRKELGASK